MPTQVHFKRNLNADDRNVYDAWMRRTLFAYMALVLLGIGLMAVLEMTNAGSVADFDAAAVGMVAP